MDYERLRERIRERSVPEPTSGCWLWLDRLDPKGYPEIDVEGRVLRAHRVSIEAYVLQAPIPVGFLACHKCDQPSCVNPDHLYVGTAKDNMRDRVERGRHPLKNRSTCIRGHVFDEENTRIYIEKRGGATVRICKKCRLEHVKAWKKAHPEKAREQKRRSRKRKILSALHERVKRLEAEIAGLS